ncbi:hypothetical protein [Streptomyces sp. NPDC005859]|uniref:hypothetical protein n=1 Tax=Streptomyces sp. NPDC005859 TaxID=3157170 RepID=UPI0033EB3FDE
MTSADSAGIGNRDVDNEVFHNEVGEGGAMDEAMDDGVHGAVNHGVVNHRGVNHGGVNHGGVNHGGLDGEVMDDSEAARGTRVSATHLRVLVAASGWLALAATAVPGPSPLRWIPVLLFVLFGPGCAALYPQPGGLASGARLEAVALAAPVSLSLEVLTATSLFLVEAFSVTAFLVSLACFTTVTAALPGLPLPAARRGAVERAKVRRRPSGGSDT